MREREYIDTKPLTLKELRDELGELGLVLLSRPGARYAVVTFPRLTHVAGPFALAEAARFFREKETRNEAIMRAVATEKR